MLRVKLELKGYLVDGSLPLDSLQSHLVFDFFVESVAFHLGPFLLRILSQPIVQFLGVTIAYRLRRWDGLSLFLKKPDLPLDNNLAENSIRPYIVGRKNWLFSNSHAGASASAALYSLIETAKANGINSNIFLKALFERFPKAEGDDQIKDLLPCYINLDMKA